MASRLFEETIWGGAMAGMSGGLVFKLAFVGGGGDGLFDVMEIESEATSVE